MRNQAGVLRRLAVAAVMLVVVACTSGEGTQEQAASQGELGELIPPLSLSYYAADYGPTYEQSARVLADEFSQLGLEIELTPLQFSTFVDQVSQGQQLEDLALGSKGGDPNRLDPNFWLVTMSTCDSNQNAVKWCDPAYDEIALEQARTVDVAERRELAWEAQEYFQSELPWWQVSHQVSGMIFNSDRWENVTLPAPVPPHETVLHPWLQMRPTGDDRILEWAHLEDLSTYNILAETGSVGWLRFIYDPLVRFDQGEVVPWAATDWAFIDDTTVELTLREGMTFHDGEPVTVDDAVFSINYLVEWQPPEFADALLSIEGAEKVSDSVLRINLAEPNPAIFGQALTALPILPQHIWESVPESVGVAEPGEWDPIQDGAVIGSGPFTFQGWQQNQVHELGVHRNHWAAPDYDGIRRLSLGQADAVRAAMLDGSADIATAVLPAAAMEQLAGEADHLEFVRSPTFNTTMVWLNHEKEPFNDLAFRRALRLATNKERVALEGWLGFAEAAGAGNVPVALDEWHSPDLEEIPYDIEQARQVLEEAGYGWDEQGRLHFPAGTS